MRYLLLIAFIFLTLIRHLSCIIALHDMETRSSAQLALATSPGEEVRAETALQVVPGPGGKESHLLELMLSIRCYLQEYS